MHLYLIRHAQSQNNALPEPQRVEDPGLTELGLQQAKALAERLQEANIDILLTSAFRRAMQTLWPVSQKRNQGASIWTDLHEHGGCYRGHIDLVGAPGMNKREIEDQFPGFQVPDDIGEEGWWRSQPFETWQAAEIRAKRVVARLVDEFGGSGKSLACLIHADIKALLLNEMLGKDHPVWSGSADLLNTSVTELTYDGKSFEMATFNDASHVGPEAS